MNKGTKLNLVSDINGGVTISNEDTKITIQPDGTVAVSTTAPLQLTGASLAKLDNDRECFVKGTKHVVDALARRLDLKKN